MDLPVRHTLATLAYRLGKVLRDTPADFGHFSPGSGARTPAQILAHIGDLMDWALTQIEGPEKWHDSTPLAWPDEIGRFFAAIQKLDAHIAAHGLGAANAERLFQGAIADALTHTGQISLLRRMAEIPVRAENYSRADIVAGRVGAQQTPPKREF